MRKEIFETGKTVDSAIDSACEKLGCPREECEWEIIDLPKKGFLGLKNTPAKVRVSIEVQDEKPLVNQMPPQKNYEQKAPEKKSPEQRTTAASRAEKRVKPKSERAGSDKPEKTEKQRPVNKPEQIMAEAAAKESESVKTDELTEKERLAREYLSKVIGATGLKADFVVSRDHGSCCINVVGEGLGMIIGRRGETLDALQYLTGLAANRGDGEYLRLTVDCGNYRLKRKDTLEALAKKLAAQVLKTNVSKVLEPMNPFERRVIHATISNIEGVSSSSVGEEPMRRVVITSPTARPAPRGGYRDQRRPPRRNDYGDSPARHDGERPERPTRESGDYNRGRRGRDDRRSGGKPQPRRSSPPPSGPPKQTPESEAISGISFGKIDLE